jgi:hypothetical protein
MTPSDVQRFFDRLGDAIGTGLERLENALAGLWDWLAGVMFGVAALAVAFGLVFGVLWVLAAILSPFEHSQFGPAIVLGAGLLIGYLVGYDRGRRSKR